MLRRPGPGPYYEVHHGGHHWFALLLFLLLLAALGLAALTLWRTYRTAPAAPAAAPAPPPAPAPDPALAELRLRYARGDIDRDDYLRRSVDLGESPPPPQNPAAGDS